MKYYFFRDLRHEDNLLDGKTHHAAGIVDKMFCEIGKPNRSGKDVSVTFFEPFKGTLTSAWRSLDKIELFEVEEWEYNLLAEKHKSIEVL